MPPNDTARRSLDKIGGLVTRVVATKLPEGNFPKIAGDDFSIDDAGAKSPKAILESDESERVALASAIRFAGAPHAGRIPRYAPTSVPDADSIPARRQR